MLFKCSQIMSLTSWVCATCELYNSELTDMTYMCYHNCGKLREGHLKLYDHKLCFLYPTLVRIPWATVVYMAF